MKSFAFEVCRRILDAMLDDASLVAFGETEKWRYIVNRHFLIRSSESSTSTIVSALDDLL